MMMMMIIMLLLRWWWIYIIVQIFVHMQQVRTTSEEYIQCNYIQFISSFWSQKHFKLKTNIDGLLFDIKCYYCLKTPRIHRYTKGYPWKESWHHFKTRILGNVDGFWSLFEFWKQTDVELLSCVRNSNFKNVKEF